MRSCLCNVVILEEVFEDKEVWPRRRIVLRNGLVVSCSSASISMKALITRLLYNAVLWGIRNVRFSHRW